jgi:hypothetical protein
LNAKFAKEKRKVREGICGGAGIFAWGYGLYGGGALGLLVEKQMPGGHDNKKGKGKDRCRFLRFAAE